MTVNPTLEVNPPTKRKSVSTTKPLAPGTAPPAKGPTPIPEKSPPATIDGPPPTPKHQPASPPRSQQPVIPPGTPKVPQSAHAIVNNFLAQYGLQSLGNWAWTRYAELGGGSNALQQISVEMTQQPAFLKRFPAYAKLAAEGEAMSPCGDGVLRGDCEAGVPRGRDTGRVLRHARRARAVHGEPCIDERTPIEGATRAVCGVDRTSGM